MNKMNKPYDILIIGTGIAGCAAALFAADKGLSCAIAGETGEIIYSSGLIDLMGVYPIHERKIWENPWDAISALRKDDTGHPYDKMDDETMKKGLQTFVDHLKKVGLTYVNSEFENRDILMPAGTVKSTWLIPETMVGNSAAYKSRKKCVIVGINGLQGFSSRQIASSLTGCWPDISFATMDFPGSEGKTNLFTEQMARSLEPEHNRQRFADVLKIAAKGFDCAGLPAIFGVTNPGDVLKNLERRTGLTLFEIPTMPPSISGIRLREAFFNLIPGESIHAHFNRKVLSADSSEDKCFTFEVESTMKPIQIKAKTALLATGRFIGQGLSAGHDRIRENLFNLPLYQPESREQWHSKDFLDPSGHLVNLAGIETDKNFRPIDHKGNLVFPNLFSAGTILAHQDWKRMKCGSGLAITTAYAAVCAATQYLKR